MLPLMRILNLGTFYFVIIFNIEVADSFGLRIPLNRLQQLDSHSHSLQLLSKKSSEDDKLQIKEAKKEKKRKLQEGWKLQEEENISQPDVLQIAQLYEDKPLPENVRNRLSLIELIFLNDISIFQKTFPGVEISDEFIQRNERIKRGGDLMGNDLELLAHKNGQLQASSFDKKMVRRSYFDDLSASHVCTATANDLQEVHIKDLKKGSINDGKIIWMTVAEPPYSFPSSSEVTILASNSEGDLKSLTLCNTFPSITTNADVQDYLQVGTKIGIKEPLMKCLSTGYYGLHVENPCNVEICRDIPKLACVSHDPFQQDGMENYYGPIEIRDAGKKGRGLFLTRDVKEGEVLLRESAFAYSYYREGNIAVNLKANCYSDGSQLSTVTDLVIAATNNATVNTMLSFLSNSKTNAISNPTIDMFRSGINLPPSPQLSAYVIEGIVTMNAFEIAYGSQRGTGLWVVTSFCNHETYENTIVKNDGKVKTFIAKKDLKNGDEMSISYGTDSALLKRKWGI